MDADLKNLLDAAKKELDLAEIADNPVKQRNHIMWAEMRLERFFELKKQRSLGKY